MAFMPIYGGISAITNASLFVDFVFIDVGY